MKQEILQGDALTVLRTMESEQFYTCITSPPYFGLRDYGADGQIGIESTPELYIEKLVEPCILAGAPEGGAVLDPFAGSGTTGAVAKRLRREFIGIEVNADYAQIARRRIAETEERMDQIRIAGI